MNKMEYRQTKVFVHFLTATVVIPVLLIALLVYDCRPSGGASPNIVFILTDDLGWGDLSCYGSNPDPESCHSRKWRVLHEKAHHRSDLD